MSKKIKQQGKPLAECPRCKGKDIGWCTLHGGWWCACGSNCEDRSGPVDRDGVPLTHK